MRRPGILTGPVCRYCGSAVRRSDSPLAPDVPVWLHVQAGDGPEHSADVLTADEDAFDLDEDRFGPQDGDLEGGGQ